MLLKRVEIRRSDWLMQSYMITKKNRQTVMITLLNPIRSTKIPIDSEIFEFSARLNPMFYCKIRSFGSPNRSRTEITIEFRPKFKNNKIQKRISF